MGLVHDSRSMYPGQSGSCHIHEACSGRRPRNTEWIDRGVAWLGADAWEGGERHVSRQLAVRVTVRCEHHAVPAGHA